jgi:hypothetical protein
VKELESLVDERMNQEELNNAYVRRLDAANSSSGSWDTTLSRKTTTHKKQDKNYTWFGQYCIRPQSTPDILLYHFE